MPRVTPPTPEQEALLEKTAAVAAVRREAESRYEEALQRYNASLVEAYTAGLRFSQIAERVGTSGETVRRIVTRELGADPNTVRVQGTKGRAARLSDPGETVSSQEQ